jgi:hypothetical protein
LKAKKALKWFISVHKGLFLLILDIFPVSFVNKISDKPGKQHKHNKPHQVDIRNAEQPVLKDICINGCS